MELSKKWNYDYDARCECSDDDRCGCTFPDNMGRSFVRAYSDKNTVETVCKPVLVGQQAFNFVAPAVFADGSSSEVFNFLIILPTVMLCLFFIWPIFRLFVRWK